MSKLKNPNIPGPIPPGYVKVIFGTVLPGDLLWCPETEKYEVAERGELGFMASGFKRVIREEVDYIKYRRVMNDWGNNMTHEKHEILEMFKKERNEALLSMDESKIRAMVLHWNGETMSDNPEVFWGAVHKTITEINTLPLEFRKASKKWLDERGYKSLDDGDL